MGRARVVVVFTGLVPYSQRYLTHVVVLASNSD